MNQESRLRKIDEIRTYLTEEINQSELVSKKHEKVCGTLHYIAHSLTIISFWNYWMRFHFCFSFFGTPMEIAIPTVGLKISAVTARIKKYKSMNKKRRWKMKK